jgi:hypothetical protein
LQGKCIACLPRPQKNFDLRFLILDLAGRCGAAPHKLSFGDSAAQAGARPIDVRALPRSKSSIENLKSKISMVRSPGVAPGRAPWRGAILLLNHNREIKKAGSDIALPACAIFTPARKAPGISTKNKHLLPACAANPRFHGGSFGVWGHTSYKALKL